MAEYIEKTLITTELPFVMMKYGNYFNERQIEKIVEIVYELENSIESADVQPVNQWISIDERLPQDGEEALVYAGNRGVMIGLYDSVLQVWLDYECCGLKVTHWQPLPEPPKKEG